MKKATRARARHWLMAGVLLAITSGPAPLRAQTTSKPPRAAVLVTFGAMRPLESAVRGLYRGAFVPVTIEGDFHLLRNLFVFGSARFLGRNGEVVFNMPPAPEERFPLRVSLPSVRMGGGVAFPWQKWLFSAGAGLSYTRYEEKWTTEDIPVATGHIYGVIAQGGVDYRVYKRLWAVGRFEYSYTPMDETRQVFPTFDLSGISVSGGVAVRF